MYERFTDRSRKVMVLAEAEARRFNHEYIGTEHVLLGLVREGAGVAANVLKNLDIDFRKVLREVEKIIWLGPSGYPVIPEPLPLTPRTKNVVKFAREEAQNLKHNYVGTEHLLLGLLREDVGVAAQVLMNVGLNLEDVRAEVLNLLGHSPDSPETAEEEPPALEVIKVPKKLREAETYPVSDFDESSEASDTPTEESAADSLAVLDRLVQRLHEAVQASVGVGDFEVAARFRDEAETLARLLAWYRENRERP